MVADSTVRARIDGATKDEAAKVLDAMGLTVSDAIRVMLMRVAAEKALPFELRVPNTETRKAMAELERGKAARFDTIDDLMADLNAPD
jgi:DNA-damage-inducible protein J